MNGSLPAITMISRSLALPDQESSRVALSMACAVKLAAAVGAEAEEFLGDGVEVARERQEHLHVLFIRAMPSLPYW